MAVSHPSAKKTLLLNFVYCNPVGHVIEALKLARGFHDANKDKDIYLILNSRSPVELAKSCDWVTKVYSADPKEVLEKNEKSKFFAAFPKTWDYILADYRSLNEDEEDIKNFQKVSKKVLKARKYYGDIWNKKAYPKEIKYIPDSKVTLRVPEKAKKFAKKYNYDGLKICIMLGGSGGSKNYPSLKIWAKIIESIKREFPKVRMYLTGVTKSKGGRTRTLAYSQNEIKRLLQIDGVVNCYDIGLWNQLALISKCDVFLAPHTGFAFLAPCVGTPWLALSRGDWQEGLFNKVPFYSVLPDVTDYPRHASKKKLKLKQGEKIPEMRDSKLGQKIPEMITGIRLLTDRSFTYQKAIKLHVKKIKESRTIQSAYFSFDDVLGL